MKVLQLNLHLRRESARTDRNRLERPRQPDGANNPNYQDNIKTRVASQSNFAQLLHEFTRNQTYGQKAALSDARFTLL